MQIRKVLVCGDQGWNNEQMIRDELSRLPKRTTVIEGEGKGADLMARKVAEELGMKVVKVPANWKKEGLTAGPKRNIRMLDMWPDLVLAFHSEIWRSKGTRHCVKEARARGIKTEVIMDIIPRGVFKTQTMAEQFPGVFQA